MSIPHSIFRHKFSRYNIYYPIKFSKFFLTFTCWWCKMSIPFHYSSQETGHRFNWFDLFISSSGLIYLFLRGKIHIHIPKFDVLSSSFTHKTHKKFRLPFTWNKASFTSWEFIKTFLRYLKFVQDIIFVADQLRDFQYTQQQLLIYL